MYVSRDSQQQVLFRIHTGFPFHLLVGMPKQAPQGSLCGGKGRVLFLINNKKKQKNASLENIHCIYPIYAQVSFVVLMNKNVT